jgi:hypothetical protein
LDRISLSGQLCPLSWGTCREFRVQGQLTWKSGVSQEGCRPLQQGKLPVTTVGLELVTSPSMAQFSVLLTEL